MHRTEANVTMLCNYIAIKSRNKTIKEIFTIHFQEQLADKIINWWLVY